MRKSLAMTFISIFLIILVACGKNTYEIDREVSVEFEGYDEYGKAVVNIDRDRLYSELSEVKDSKDNSEVNALHDLVEDLDVQIPPDENLKNGDDIELELLYDEDNSLNFDLKLKESKVTVENLEPITTLSQEDIFSGVELEYEGISPFLKAHIIESSSGEVTGLFNYSIPDKRFANNEEVEIKAEPISDLISSGYEADEEDFAMTVEVPVQKKYIEEWNELNKDDQEYVLGEIHDTVTAKVDAQLQQPMYSIYDKGKNATNGNFVKERGESERNEQYFLFVKENEFENVINYNEEPNSVRFVYQNEISTREYIYDENYSNVTKDLFSVVGASHLIIDENGDLVKNELKVGTYKNPDMDKETVKNEALYKVKDKYTMDEFDIDSEE